MNSENCFKLAVLFSAAALVISIYSHIDYQNRLETFKLYDGIPDDIDWGVNGLYWSDRYYCVWTKGRSIPEINETDHHEACHHFVYTEPLHFCGGYYAEEKKMQAMQG